MPDAFPAGRYLLDTSCLVKLVVDEQDEATRRTRELEAAASDAVVLCITRYGLVETLGVLKAKTHSNRPDQIDQAQYAASIFALFHSLYEGKLKQIDSLPPLDALVAALWEAHRSGTDVVDTLHLYAILRPYTDVAGAASSTYLVSTDEALVRLAGHHGFAVWNPQKRDRP